MKPNEFFKKLQNSLPRLQQEIVSQVIKGEADNFHRENFRKEGFTDKSFKKWTPRKKKERGPRRGLLVQTGDMKGHAMDGKVRSDHVEYVFPLPYMKVHNEGGKAGRGGSATMPKRQYVGGSAELKRRIQQKAQQVINKHINRL